MTLEISGLVAYPSYPEDIGETISRSLKIVRSHERFHNLTSWEENDIPGRFITTEILDRIERGSIFIADITMLNFNVVYEIGYAIGCKKRAFLIRNKTIQPNTELVRQVGVFDTLGYVDYSSYSSLASIIHEITNLAPLKFDDSLKSNTSPVYIILPQIKGDYETHLISRIKKARLHFRSFDPAEHGRLPALEAIKNVASAHGVVIPLLPSHRTDANIHNLRAAFVAGLSQGMGKLVLLLQSGDDPVPLDYCDLVSKYKFPEQIDEYISEFAVSVTESLQSTQPSIISKPSTFLSQMTIGASSAENEFQELGNYYIETDEYRRALRGEVQVVIGRKGAGKSALFFRLRDQLRDNKQNVVLDLKPEGFQLIKFKEIVLKYLEEGTQGHTLTAFWEYLLLLEICHKLLQIDKNLHLRDHTLYDSYLNLANAYDSDEYVSEGDFSQRMLRLTQRIADDFSVAEEHSTDRRRLSSEEITRFIYKHDLADLYAKLIDYLQHKKSVWILFDNLDKGWSPYGVEREDVLSIHCLLDAMGKLERELRLD